MKFSEMKYERPDLQQSKIIADKIQNELKNAVTFEQADKAFIDWDQFTAGIDTMISLAYTRHTIDTADQFYDKEVEYIDEVSPEFTDIQQSFSKLLVESTFRPQLEEKYGSLLFKNAEIFLKAFSPEIILI